MVVAHAGTVPKRSPVVQVENSDEIVQSLLKKLEGSPDGRKAGIHLQMHLPVFTIRQVELLGIPAWVYL